jgi:hypothetical protein
MESLLTILFSDYFMESDTADSPQASAAESSGDTRINLREALKQLMHGSGRYT